MDRIDWPCSCRIGPSRLSSDFRYWRRCCFPCTPGSKLLIWPVYLFFVWSHLISVKLPSTSLSILDVYPHNNFSMGQRNFFRWAYVGYQCWANVDLLIGATLPQCWTCNMLALCWPNRYICGLALRWPYIERYLHWPFVGPIMLPYVGPYLGQNTLLPVQSGLAVKHATWMKMNENHILLLKHWNIIWTLTAIYAYNEANTTNVKNRAPLQKFSKASKAVENKMPTNWWGRLNGTPLKFDRKTSETEAAFVQHLMYLA